MNVIEIIMVCLMISLGIITSIKDIREGRIPNKVLAVFVTAGIILDLIYYALFVSDTTHEFLLNVLIVSVISLILFFLHSFAGGDCKLFIVYAVMYPSGLYFSYGNSTITLIFALCIAIFLGYLYLLLNAVWKIMTGENHVTGQYVKAYLLNYLKSYLTAFIYITLANLIMFAISGDKIMIPSWAFLVICIAVAWTAGKVKALRKKTVISAAIIAVAIFSVVLKRIPVSLNPGSYLFTAILILLQMTIRTNIYETIPAYKVRKGMILSMGSSMLMQNSRIKNIPGISTEDLRDRLTEEQANSVGRWAASGQGEKEIVIVKKIPFAIFIFLGFICYFVIGRIFI